MKKPYEEMKVNLVGAVSQVVAKSGSYLDCSQQFDTKGPDEGGGQEKKCS